MELKFAEKLPSGTVISWSPADPRLLQVTDLDAIWGRLTSTDRAELGRLMLGLMISGRSLSQLDEMRNQPDRDSDNLFAVARAFEAAGVAISARSAEIFDRLFPVTSDFFLAPPDLAQVGIRSCIRCGCTDVHACEGGCAWIAPRICSRCW